MPSSPSPPSVKQASPEQIRWLRSPVGQWSRVEQAWDEYLDSKLLEAEASGFGLEPSDISLPRGDPAALVKLYLKANPDLSLLDPPKDNYDLVVGVLRMLIA